jgi:hypothetical protein
MARVCKTAVQVESSVELLDDDTKCLFKEHVNAVVGSIGVEAHRRAHVLYLKVAVDSRSRISTFDLCDFFVWCKCSSILGSKPRQDLECGGLRVAVITTPFLNALVVAEPLHNADKCKVALQNGDKTVQLRVVFNRGFRGDVVIGVCLKTPGSCMECRALASDTCKLRACSRCYEFDKVRVLYCSPECQKKHYPEHRPVCKGHWASDV